MYPSLVRTVVPLVVGVLLAQAARVGLNLPEGAVTEIVTVVVAAAYYALARLIEQYVPTLGRFLVSLGLTGRAPLYVSTQKAYELRRVDDPTATHPRTAP